MSITNDKFQRTSLRYRFDDADMDTFFAGAMGWTKGGGLDAGELYAIAHGIADGDGESWTERFSAHGAMQRSVAADRLARGRRRSAAESLLKASASFRSAWQFCSPGEQLTRLLRDTQATFREAIGLLDWPAEFFGVPYEGAELPVLLLRASDVTAPTLLVTGATIDALIERRIDPAKIVLIGFSLGGYWAARAAGHEQRLAACVASTPFPEPRELFGSAATQAAADRGASRSNTDVLLWKGGAKTMPELAARMDNWIADPADVRCPFLSIVGGAEPSVLMRQALGWHERLDVPRKDLISYDQATGADAHCQLNNPTLMMQDVSDWVLEVVGDAGSVGQGGGHVADPR